MLDYVVHGAGGIGCVVAARLHAAGRSVGLIARGAHLDALQANGLKVVGDTEFEALLPAAATAAELAIGPETVVLLTMKSNDTASALDSVGRAYDGLPIFCIQNGVANEDLVAGRGLRAYGCRVVLGGRILEPGVVAHTGFGILTIGCWPTGIDKFCRAFSADLEMAGLEAPLHENVRAAKWGKLLANVNNAYLALTNTSVQASRRFEAHRYFLADVQEEAVRRPDGRRYRGRRRPLLDHPATDRQVTGPGRVGARRNPDRPRQAWLAVHLAGSAFPARPGRGRILQRRSGSPGGDGRPEGSAQRSPLASL